MPLALYYIATAERYFFLPPPHDIFQRLHFPYSSIRLNTNCEQSRGEYGLQIVWVRIWKFRHIILCFVNFPIPFITNIFLWDQIRCNFEKPITDSDSTAQNKSEFCYLLRRNTFFLCAFVISYSFKHMTDQEMLVILSISI